MLYQQQKNPFRVIEFEKDILQLLNQLRVFIVTFGILIINILEEKNNTLSFSAVLGSQFGSQYLIHRIDDSADLN